MQYSSHGAIVVTGGPGGGKTTSLDLFQRELKSAVKIVPEAATLLFGHGLLADANVSRNSLAHSQSTRVRLDADPASWQRPPTSCDFPPETDCLVIRTGMCNDSQVPGRRTDEFGAHYVEDVQLVIGHRPELVTP